MAKVNISFKTKFEAAVDARIGRALANMEEMAVCAGIRDNKESAFKARVNHYGGVITQRKRLQDVGVTKSGRRHIKLVTDTTQIRIPPRRFIDVPLEKGSWAVKDLEEKIAKILSGGRVRTVFLENGFRHDSPSSFGQGGGLKTTLKMIANQLADAQINAVYAAQPDNAESTRKRKGFNAPLRETYDMVDSIEGWTE